MSDYRSDLPYIKWGLITLLLALGTGGTAIFLSQDFLDRSQLAHSAAERKLTEARHNLNTANDDRQNMASYAQEYSMLLKRNIIGNERRLDWIDGLERLRRRNLVMDFNYTISPQKPYKPPVPLDSGNFDLRRSDMALSFDLLHEGQLMDFFDALRSDVKGWFMLDGCTITRNTASSGNDAAPQLKAECSGGWVTLKNRNAP
jgi:hypothetical protein